MGNSLFQGYPLKVTSLSICSSKSIWQGAKMAVTHLGLGRIVRAPRRTRRIRRRRMRGVEALLVIPFVIFASFSLRVGIVADFAKLINLLQMSRRSSEVSSKRLTRSWAGVGFIVAAHCRCRVKSYYQYSDRLACLKLKVPRGICGLITAYAPHNLKPLSERLYFYVQL